MSEKSVLQKLLVKEGYQILILDAPQGYADSLGDLPAGVVLTADPAGTGPYDLIQAFVTSQSEYEAQVSGLKARLKPKGLLWITYRKGAARIKSDITRDTIWSHARTIGLDGVAMVAVDDVWSAMRLKIVS